MYNRKDDKFLDVCTYTIFTKHMPSLQKVLKNTFAKISSVMNKSIEEIEWTAMTQGWALVTTKKPHGIILRDEKRSFCWFPFQ